MAIGFEVVVDEVVVLFLDGAELPKECGFTGDDVGGGAAVDLSDVDCRPWGVEGSIFRRILFEGLAEFGKFLDVEGGEFDGVDSVLGVGAVSFESGEMHFVG